MYLIQEYIDMLKILPFDIIRKWFKPPSKINGKQFIYHDNTA
jgi:hypothetical protein